MPLSDTTDYEARALYAEKMAEAATVAAAAQSWQSIAGIYRELARQLAKLRADSTL